MNTNDALHVTTRRRFGAALALLLAASAALGLGGCVSEKDVAQAQKEVSEGERMIAEAEARKAEADRQVREAERAAARAAAQESELARVIAAQASQLPALEGEARAGQLAAIGSLSERLLAAQGLSGEAARLVSGWETRRAEIDQQIALGRSAVAEAEEKLEAFDALEQQRKEQFMGVFRALGSVVRTIPGAAPFVDQGEALASQVVALGGIGSTGLALWRARREKKGRMEAEKTAEDRAEILRVNERFGVITADAEIKRAARQALSPDALWELQQVTRGEAKAVAGPAAVRTFSTGA